MPSTGALTVGVTVCRSLVTLAQWSEMDGCIGSSARRVPWSAAMPASWSRWRWRTSKVADSSAVKVTATMVGTVLVEHGGNNRVIVAPGALGALNRSDVVRNAAVLTDADVVLISLEIPDDVALAAAKIAHEAGVLTILNPAPAPDIVSAVALCAHVDVITPNRSEAALLGGRGESAEAIAASLRDRFGVVVVMTDGDRGSVIADPGGVRTVPAVVVDDVTDTSGAGDAFSTALSVALAQGGDVDQAVEFATQAASRIVRGPGFVEALDHWAGLGFRLPESS